MKPFITCACLMLTAGSLLAQNYYMATQQARRDSAQNDAEQQRIQKEAGGAAGAPASAPAPAPAAPMDPALKATLKNVGDLQADFTLAINSTGDKSDPAQKTSLLNNLSQAAQGTKASTDSIKKVADDLTTALAGKKKLTVPQLTKLAREVHALFNSAHLTPAQQQTILTDVQKILTDGGASVDDAVNTVTDLKVVVAETK